MPHCFSKDLTSLEERIGYTFKDKALLVTALTHSSFRNENPQKVQQDNERLEFLGDAVLELSIVEALYRTSPELSEAQMARYKAYLVSKNVLARLAREIDLGNYLRLGKGEQKTGGTQKEGILANAAEALIGAIFLDSSYETTKNMIYSLMGPTIKECIEKDPIYDYKTALQEYAQQRFRSLPEYRVISENGKDHNKVFTVEVLVEGRPIGRGQGHSKKEAQMKAAYQALKELEKV